MGAELLARAGVGELVLIDRDIVDSTNLQRQVLFDEQAAAAGMAKVGGCQTSAQFDKFATPRDSIG